MKRYLCSLLFLTCFAHTGFAATWTGGGGDNNWSTGANWGGTAPVNGDDLDFFSFSPRPTNINDLVGFQTPKIELIPFAGPAYSISGNAITFANGGLSATFNFASPALTSNTLSNNFVLNDNLIFTNTISLLGDLILQGAISGSKSIEVDVPGQVVTLTNSSNSYTGGSTITKGTLRAGAANVFSTGTMEVNGSVQTSTLDLNNFDQTISLLTFTSAGGKITLGSATLTVGNNLPSLFNGPISGTGGLTKVGSSSLTLNDTQTYTGPTLINEGTLMMNGGAPVGMLSSSTEVTVATGATFNLAGNAQTIGNLAGGGSVLLGGATLTFGNANDSVFSGVISGGALTKQGAGKFTVSGNNTYAGTTTLLAGIVELSAAGAKLGSGAGSIAMSTGTTLQVSADGVSLINPFSLTGTDTFQITTGTTTLSGPMSGAGGVIKTGMGTLLLSGANTYAGATSVSAGTLTVNGSLTSAVTVSSGALFKGIGTITGAVVNNGRLAPGNSIGTMNVVGPVTFGSGSIYEVEFNPTANDLLNVTGSVVISSGVTLALIPTVGDYDKTTTYTIIKTTTGVTGTFSTITNTQPALKPTVVHTPDGKDVQLVITFLPIAPIVPSENEQALGSCLDKADPPTGSDLRLILNQLHFESAKALPKDLNKMQPSQLGGLTLAQENSSIHIRSAVSAHMESWRQPLCAVEDGEQQLTLTPRRRPQSVPKAPFSEKGTVWVDGFGSVAQQKEEQDQLGFHTDTGAALVGVDGHVNKKLHLGFGGGYSSTDLDWQKDRGSGDVSSYYGFLYGSWVNRGFFLDAAVMGAFNQYEAQRKINFLIFDRTAESSFNGSEFAAHMSLGGLISHNQARFIPFLSFDYIALHTQGFTEQGAQAFDLKVKSRDSDLFRSEAGVSYSQCFGKKGSRWIPKLQLSVIRELRYGSHITASLKDFSCNFTVKGLSPDRTLISPVAGLTALFMNERLSISLEYAGEFSKNFWEQTLNLQVGCVF